MKTLYVDVREPDEFNGKHLKDSVNIPMSAFKGSADAVKKIAGDFKVVLICQSGVRSGNAKKMLETAENVEVYEGGLNKWEDNSQVEEGDNASNISIFRQVMIVASLLVLIGTLGSLYLNAYLIWLAVFVGAGLLFAGVTGFCMMAKILSAMPWNN